jgi:hypothetical protein
VPSISITNQQKAWWSWAIAVVVEVEVVVVVVGCRDVDVDVDVSMAQCFPAALAVWVRSAAL